ncbi:MAG: SH3 domain-containing protein [Chloroflexota bacterium]
MRRLSWLVVIPFLVAVLATMANGPARPAVLQATEVIATVTSTPTGPVVIAPDQVNVRDGPGTNYDRIGVMVAGQRLPALGRSPGGDWIQIVYPGVPGNLGWVYAYNVSLEGAGILPVVEPPPLPTPRVTATIDPTLAAQFPSLGRPAATRLPTYSAAAPVIQPTFAAGEGERQGLGFPPILAILGLLVVGTFGTVISVLRGR